MSDTDEMRERFSKPPLDGNRCYQCNGRLGLIRHRAGLKSFCSNRCLNEYEDDTQRKISLIKEWRDFYNRKL